VARGALAEPVLVERRERALELVEGVDRGAQGAAPVVVARARVGEQRLDLVDEPVLARDVLRRRAAQADRVRAGEVALVGAVGSGPRGAR
jgi:hypothetical protein